LRRTALPEQKEPVEEKDLHREKQPDRVFADLQPADRFPDGVIASACDGRTRNDAHPDKYIT